jgi:hypothetical protein
VIRCVIQAGAVSYIGLFTSTTAALLDAFDRFPDCRAISARAIK